MTSIHFAKTELAAAIGRGIRQLVIIGSRPPLGEAFNVLGEAFNGSSCQSLQVFAVDEEQHRDSPATFIPTQFTSETLAMALNKSNFDRLKTSLFIWLGSTAYRTIDAVMASLSFIASLPKDSGVIFDYIGERTQNDLLPHTALDALASRIPTAGGNIKHEIQPPAVAVMLRAFGFQTIVDFVQEEKEIGGAHFVSASV